MSFMYNPFIAPFLGGSVSALARNFKTNYRVPVNRPSNYQRMSRGGPNVANPRRGPQLRRFGNNYGKRRNPISSQGGIEVNRNEGGWKNINQGLVYITRSCDNIQPLYMKAVSAGSDYIFNDFSNRLNLKNLLLDNDEFTTYRLLCTKYRLIGVRITVNYSNHFPVNTVLGKLVLTPETDLVKITDPLINKNSMKLDMSRPGVKNFNFNLNKSNMDEDHVDWYPKDSDWDGNLYLSVSNMGQNKNGNDTATLIGSFKVSLIVKFALQDIGTSVKKLLQGLPDLKEKLVKTIKVKPTFDNDVLGDSSKSPPKDKSKDVQRTIEFISIKEKVDEISDYIQNQISSENAVDEKKNVINNTGSVVDQ